MKFFKWFSSVFLFLAMGMAMAQEGFFGLGNRLLVNKSFAAARKAYELAIDQNQYHAGAWFNLGVVNFQERNLSAAERCYSRALELNRESVSIFSGIGAINMEQGNYVTALQHFLRSARLSVKEHASGNAESIRHYEQSMFNLGLALRSYPGDIASAQQAISQYAGGSLNYRFFFREALQSVFSFTSSQRRMNGLCSLRYFFPSDWDKAGDNVNIVQILSTGGKKYGQKSPRHAGDKISRHLRLTPIVTGERDNTLYYRDRTVFVAAMSGETVIDGRAVGTMWNKECNVFLRSSDILPPHGYVFGNLLRYPRAQDIAQVFPIALNAISRWNDNYYHFMIEALPRLILLLTFWEERRKISFGNEKHPYLILQDGPVFIQKTVDMILAERYPHLRDFVYFLKLGEVVKIEKRLYTVEWHGVRDEDEINLETASTRFGLRAARKFVYETVQMHPGEMDDAQGSKEYHRFFFVSRRLHDEMKCARANEDRKTSIKASLGRRILANHDEVMSMFHSVLETSIGPWKLVTTDGCRTMRDTVNLWRTAAIICGVHGAGLSNLLFVPPGNTLIEITPQEAAFRDYFHLAMSLDIELWTVPIQKRGIYNGHGASTIHAPISLLQKVVEISMRRHRDQRISGTEGTL
jgi:hypothetical protein